LASAHTGLGGIAGRYASALFELADEQRALDSVAADLKSLKAMIADSADLTRMLRSPVIGRDDQLRAIQAIAEQAGFGPITKNFLGVIASNRRLFVLVQVIDAFLGELARRRGEMTADVTAAYPLTAEQVAAVTGALRTKLGAKVSLNVSVDPALIGGLVVKVGSRLIDSSVRTKLNRLENAMKGVA
jgi:F-type H+-transporting ATPase subunit delta